MNYQLTEQDLLNIRLEISFACMGIWEDEVRVQMVEILESLCATETSNYMNNK